MFADLVGFTTYSEGRDPEDVREVLTRYFDSARQIVERYGGVVEKFIGDAVMAVWGTPAVREDDAERAVRAALDLVDEVASLGRAVGGELRARAGVVSGEAAVTIGAQGQGMVAGDAVNTAARLQSNADPGTLLVDEATYLAARDAISFEENAKLLLKGKEEPVATWRPVRVVGGRRGFRPGDALEPPFTGRDEELRLIKDLMLATGREAKPRLASVIGLGGVGKSRLVWELYKFVDGLSDDIYWHQGRSPAYGDGVAFWALAEMVRMRTGIAETDSPEESASKLTAALQEWVPDEVERSWIEPRLEQLLGLAPSDEKQEQLFAAWRRFFELIAEQGTVILVFEDIHWADPGLIDFIEHVMAWARTSPIFIVTLARPELMDRRPGWGAGQRNFVGVHLEPLAPDDLRLLLKGLVSDLPAPILEEVVDRAEGIPLYAVEMVRMLIDRKQLVPEGTGYRWAGTVEHVDVPDSLHSLIASRLDSLPVEDRLLVQDAAVLGKTFTIESLAKVAEADVERMEIRLRDLSQREIFTIDADPRSPERGQYGFVQSLIKEVAYQTLAKSDRAERHIRAAEYFESLDELDLTDVVAIHYVQAFTNTGPGERANTLAAKACAKLVEAAERAASLGSHAQAAVLYQSALDVASESNERARLMFMLGDATGSAGNVELAIAHIQEAVALADEVDDSDLRARARARLGSLFLAANRISEAEEMLQAAIAEVADPETDPAAARLYAELGRIYMFKGENDKGMSMCAKAIPPAEANDLLDVLADVMLTRGVSALQFGYVREADMLIGGAMEFAERHDLPLQYSRATVNLSANLVDNDPHAAFEVVEKGLEHDRRYGFVASASLLVGNGLDAASHLGRWDWCKANVEALLETIQLEELPSAAPAVVLSYVLTGDLDEARASIAQPYMDLGTENVNTARMILEVVLLLAIVEGDRSATARYASEIERLAGKGVYAQLAVTAARAAYLASDAGLAATIKENLERYIVRGEWRSARSATIDAAVTALTGDREEAVRQYGQVLRLWDQLDLPFDKAFCQFDFALLVGSPEADEARAEARAYFEGMGNMHLARQLETSN